jgi:cytochrome c-type biogenesis protein CcmH
MGGLFKTGEGNDGGHMRLWWLSLWASMAMAGFQFDSVKEETQFWEMLSRYRCVVCQNQNIADSEATIAYSMRDFVYQQWQAGATQEDIDQALKVRYGDFVLERPEFKSATWLLWLGPVIALFAVFIGWYRRLND